MLVTILKKDVVYFVLLWRYKISSDKVISKAEGKTRQKVQKPLSAQKPSKTTGRSENNRRGDD